MSALPATVFVVIPVFNRRHFTLRCLELLERQTYPHVRVIVVDDASTDGTPEAIARRFPWVKVLRGNGNLWWSGGMFMGIEHALRVAHPNDFVLMMNNDTEFPDEYVATLVRVAQQQHAAVGALTVDAADHAKVIDAGEFIDWEEYDFPVKLAVAPGETFFDGVDVLPGRGSLVPVEMIRACGNIAKDALPHYIADYEFFCRLRRRGFRLGVTYETWITCDSTATGFYDRGGRLSFGAVLRLMFDRKSMNNVIDHLIFVWRSAPRHRRVPLMRHVMRRAAMLLLMRTVLFDLAKPFARPARFILHPYFVRRTDVEAVGLSPETLVDQGVLRPWVLEDCYQFVKPTAQGKTEDPAVARLRAEANGLWRKLGRLMITRRKVRRQVRQQDRLGALSRSA
jgi:GT2 family glycosyltransferase